MKKAISVWAFPSDWSLDRIFQTAKEAGFDGVEVALAEGGEVSLQSSQQDMERVKALADKHGLELFSVATGLYWSYSLTSNDAQVREKAKNIVKKQLQVAKWLGCNDILVVPGLVSGDVDYETAYNRAFEALNELKHDAETLQVAIGVENVWNKFLLSPLEMRDFIDKIDSSYVGVYFDVGNVLYSGYPEQWIRILSGRIRKVHFKDFSTKIGNITGFVDLLSGDVDYPAVKKALDDIGYDGWVTAEVNTYKHFPHQQAHGTAAAMRQILGS
ncbi:MAG: sugar phosphate isomerase/epimerase family protein [Christensenellales bacterium]|jgi:L-ribulose-5-phosphate 3-epimerase